MEPGFYWVRVAPDNDLTVGQLDDEGWWMVIGGEMPAPTRCVEVLSEQRLRPPGEEQVKG